MRNPQLTLALRMAAFVAWFVVNVVFWNVAKDLGWVPWWLALPLGMGCVLVGTVGNHFLHRRWQRQFLPNPYLEQDRARG